MRLRLLISAIAATILLFQPIALADSANAQILFNNQKISPFLAVENADPAENFDILKWKEKLQKNTSQLWNQFPTTYVEDFKQDFQSKLTNLEMIPEEVSKIGGWYQDFVGNITTNIENINSWSTNVVNNTKEQIDYIQTLSSDLVGNTKEQLEYIQKVSVDLAADTQKKVNDFQQWSNSLASNVKVDLSSLSNKLAEIQQSASNEANTEKSCWD